MHYTTEVGEPCLAIVNIHQKYWLDLLSVSSINFYPELLHGPMNDRNKFEAKTGAVHVKIKEIHK